LAYIFCRNLRNQEHNKEYNITKTEAKENKYNFIETKAKAKINNSAGMNLCGQAFVR
jgi:hypothetical protein